MRNNILIVFILISIVQGLTAQTNGNSPYSRFGIGDLVDDSFLHLRDMGSIGTSYIDPYHINIVNPASYASLRATAFDIGMAARKSTYSSGELSSESWSGNLQYISLAFPLSNSLNEILEQKKRPYDLGMSFTLMPNSNVSYNIESEESVDGLGSVTRRFVGDGGSYKFLWGNAIKYKDYSFGLNLGYLFGNIQYDQVVQFNDVPVAYQNVIGTQYSLSGFLFDAGGMYTRVLNQKQIDDKTDREQRIISLGLRMKSATGFSTSTTESIFGVQNPVGTAQFIDTVSYIQDSIGRGKLPFEFGIGASYYHKEKYMVGVDVSMANWSTYANDADRTVANNPLKNTFNVSLGGYYRPNHRSYNRYFKRVYYRYGVYYKTDPREIQGQQIDAYGLTFGLGMPFVYQRKISHANIGFGFGKRGSGSVIEENFFTLSLGFTFNDDEWFLKRKYN